MPSIRRTAPKESEIMPASVDAAAQPTTASAVGRFMLTSLAVLLAFGGVVVYFQKRVGADEAVRDSREAAVLIGRGIIGPLLTEDVLRGDPRALATLDGVVRSRVLDDQVVRIKVWSEDGRVIYSDRKELIGLTFPADEDDRPALQAGQATAAVSDLSEADNSYEREFGELLEVNYPLDAAGGQRVYVESYEKLGGVTADGSRIWIALAPILVGAILLLWLAQGPLAWSMARRIQRGQKDRERLLAHAVEASEAERRRIASDLHDGVVQRLAGTAYSLASIADRIPPGQDGEAAATLDQSIEVVRQSIRELRSLIVEIHPPNLTTEGLEPALSGLVAPLSAKSIDARVDVGEGLNSSPRVDKLLYRGAQEALRNILAHANAQEVVIQVAGDGKRAWLTVDDDGRGLSNDDRPPDQRDGHVGLVLLADLASEMGGSLHVGPSPSGGTRMLLEVPQA